MNNLLNQSICPLCGEANKCAEEIAKATGKPQEPCWCVSSSIAEELLTKVALEAKNKACICEKCVSQR